MDKDTTDPPDNKQEEKQPLSEEGAQSPKNASAAGTESQKPAKAKKNLRARFSDEVEVHCIEPTPPSSPSSVVRNATNVIKEYDHIARSSSQNLKREAAYEIISTLTNPVDLEDARSDQLKNRCFCFPANCNRILHHVITGLTILVLYIWLIFQLHKVVTSEDKVHLQNPKRCKLFTC